MISFAIDLPKGLFLYGSCMIRQAVPDDAVRAVPLILQAIGRIASVLSGTTDGQETTSILTDFFCQQANRLSYQNALVIEEEGVVVGVTILYDGSKARVIERAAAKKSGDSNYRIPTEPETSEFYLDSLSVSPRCQRKGYGSKSWPKARAHAHRVASRDRCGRQTVVRSTRVSCGLHQMDSGTGVFSHGKEFVMHSGVPTVSV